MEKEMKSGFIAALIIIISLNIYAQDSSAVKKDTLWVPKGIVGLNLSQVALSNWSQGGQSSVAFTFFSLFGIDYIGDVWKWKNNLKFAYGRTKFGDEEYRTNENELFFESTLIRQLNWAVSPYAGVTAQTAVTNGYNYDSIPAFQLVAFGDPFYLTEAVGFIYDRIPNFSTRLGVGLKQTWADKFYDIYTDDAGTPEIEKFKNESGIESVSEYTWPFLENMSYYGYLRLFGTFNDLSVWDVRWDNVITAKINDYINVNFNVLLIYDEDQSIKRQIKEALQLGISYSLF
jgi:hypothetical protein